MESFIKSFVIALAIGSFIAGCGGGVEDGPVSGPAPPTLDEANKVGSTAELKTRLEAVAASGQGGSGLAGIQSAIDELQDASLKGTLSKDYAQLEKASDPAKIKALAKKMADKL